MSQRGQYSIEKRLASGGMAEIYRVVYKGIRGFEKRLVMKRIRPEFSSNKEFVESLVHEANICVRLNHQNIVQVHELGSDKGTYYILMEYIDGLDLEKILNYLSKSDKRIPLELALLIIKQVSEGLEYAHHVKDGEGRPLHVVHRDISPHNIILSKDGWVKITDFGIAKAAIKTTKTIFGTFKGKLLYMSPEQARGEEVDHRSDIFSVGTLAYELLTGKKLFDAATEVAIIDKVRNAEASFPDTLDLPPSLIPILKKALTTNREKRYPSCAALIKDINDYLKEAKIEISNSDLAKYVKSLEGAIGKSETISSEKLPENYNFMEGANISHASATLITRHPLVEPDGATRKRFPLRYMGYAFTLVLLLGTSLVITHRVMTQKNKEPILEETASITLSKPIEPESKEVAAEPPKVQVNLESEVKQQDPNPAKTDGIAQVEYGRLDVFAKPWGYVTIPGLANRKTSPFRSNQIKTGKYQVTVFYEPENKVVTQQITVVKNKRTLCTVDFLSPPSTLQCR